MLKIRLARVGRKKLPHYRVVVSDSRQTPTGGFVEQLGSYDPRSKELKLDTEKTQAYLDQGTQPSSRIVKLLGDHKGITLPGWALKNLASKPDKPKAKEPAEAEAKTEEAPAEDEATPAETEVAPAEEAAATEEESEEATQEAPEQKTSEDNEKEASKET